MMANMTSLKVELGKTENIWSPEPAPATPAPAHHHYLRDANSFCQMVASIWLPGSFSTQGKIEPLIPASFLLMATYIEVLKSFLLHCFLFVSFFFPPVAYLPKCVFLNGRVAFVVALAMAKAPAEVCVGGKEDPRDPPTK